MADPTDELGEKPVEGEMPAASAEITAPPADTREIASAVDSVRESFRNEQIKEATERLHPVLREALAHPIAARDLSTIIIPKREFTRQSELLDCIDNLNSKVAAFMEAVENPEQRLRPNDAKGLTAYLASEGDVFLEGGMLSRVRIALKVLAKTKLREIAKRPSKQPFDEEEFKREQTIQQYIADLCGSSNFM